MSEKCRQLGCHYAAAGATNDVDINARYATGGGRYGYDQLYSPKVDIMTIKNNRKFIK